MMLVMPPSEGSCSLSPASPARVCGLDGHAGRRRRARARPRLHASASSGRCPSLGAA